MTAPGGTRPGAAPPGSVPPGPAPKGSVWVPGGTFTMGSDAFYPEERPAHPVAVDGFWMDAHPVTVAEFRRFVRDTGYVTVAERVPQAGQYPGAAPELLVPGALVFRMTAGPVPLDDYRRWWDYVPGASWRRPEGPGSDLGGRDRHPVTQVAFEDALAYAVWAGRDLPTEAEWEFAARGGLDGATYVWGEERDPRGKRMANIWYGDFPWRLDTPSGRPGTTPVGRYPANGYGLFDMAGNVWEWTADPWTVRHPDPAPAACCAPRNPRAEAAPTRSADGDAGGDGGEPGGFARRTVKGGSHLCAASYCLRYRPAARQGESEDTATSHLGFRTVLRPAPPAPSLSGRTALTLV